MTHLALRFLLTFLAGWVSRQQAMVESLQEESRVLREQLPRPSPNLNAYAARFV